MAEARASGARALEARTAERVAGPAVPDGAAGMDTQLFELEILGGGVERRYRKLRPDVEAMPWGTIDPAAYTERAVLAARGSWTLSAFQEYRSAVLCARVAHGLVQASAPLDLGALAAQFVVEELAHAELAGRVAMELGGAVRMVFDRELFDPPTDPSRPWLLRALETVVQVFCVGESVSLPVTRFMRDLPSVPLVRAILQRVARDEAPHGSFGWIVLDWALPRLDEAARATLGAAADIAITSLATAARNDLARGTAVATPIDPLAWMGTADGVAMILDTLNGRVAGELRSRGIPVGRA